jgi:kinesin family protein C2/C3
VEFIGEYGSLLVNTSKIGKDVQRIFNFNKVFGPSSSQEKIYINIEPLI